MPKRQYTEDEKSVTLAYYESVGRQLRKTARDCKIPLATLQRWLRGEGVNVAVRKSVPEKKADLADRLEAAAHMLLDNVPDHIDEAGLSEMFVALGISVDKFRLLRGEATSISESRQQLEQRAQEVLQRRGLRIVEDRSA